MQAENLEILSILFENMAVFFCFPILSRKVSFFWHKISARFVKTFHGVSKRTFWGKCEKKTYSIFYESKRKDLGICRTSIGSFDKNFILPVQENLWGKLIFSRKNRNFNLFLNFIKELRTFGRSIVRFVKTAFYKSKRSILDNKFFTEGLINL